MRQAARSSLLGLAAAGLLAGCPDRSISEVNPLQGRVEAKDIPVDVTRDVDILFLIDDSPSMADKQANLAANFPRFIEVLSSIQGGLPNVHIAVVTSDMGTRGADGVVAPQVGQIGKGGCTNSGKAGVMQLFGANATGGQFLSDIQPEPTMADPTPARVRNYSGTLAEAFATMATGAGAQGCGFEQHLEAMKQALVPSNTANAGFLRPDAYLAVIFIADEDDCSMQTTTLLAPENATLGPQQSFRCTRFGVTCDTAGATPDAMNQVGAKSKCHSNEGSAYLAKVNEYAKFLKSLKSDPTKVIVAGIMGTPDPVAVELRAPPGSQTKIPALAHSCSYTGGMGLEVADPAIRLKAFLDQFPNRNTFASICQRDLSGGLQQIGDLLKAVLGDPCISGVLADVNPTLPGLQPDCAVSAVRPGIDEQILKECPAGGGAASDPPCWHIEADAMQCARSPQQLKLKIERQDALTSDSHIVANCVTEVTNN